MFCGNDCDLFFKPCHKYTKNFLIYAREYFSLANKWAFRESNTSPGKDLLMQVNTRVFYSC